MTVWVVYDKVDEVVCNVHISEAAANEWIVAQVASELGDTLDSYKLTEYPVLGAALIADGSLDIRTQHPGLAEWEEANGEPNVL